MPEYVMFFILSGCVEGAVKGLGGGVGTPGKGALFWRMGTWTVWARAQLDILYA